MLPLYAFAQEGTIQFADATVKSLCVAAWDTDGEDVWLAHYVSQTDYDGQYSLWQTGVGTISGINGLVDLDVRYSH